MATRAKRGSTAQPAMSAPSSAVRGLPAAGSMRIPSTWEAETLIRLAEPLDEGLAAPLARKEAGHRPRANVRVVRRGPVTASAESLLDALLAELRSTVPSVKEVSRGLLAFDDGIQGPFVTVRYEPIAGLRTLQTHLFRIDERILTHLTGSVADRDADKLELELVPMMKSFRPEPLHGVGTSKSSAGASEDNP